jgi:hypothetical protein
MNFVGRHESVAVPANKLCYPERSGSSASRMIRRVEGTLEGPVLHLRALWLQVNRVRRLAAATIGEIFDEAAYERFLIHRRQKASVESYAAFRRDHELLASRKPRCC